jgi:hypothetical protein
VRRLVLETAIGPVLAMPLGKLRAARWDSAGATAEGTQDPAPDRAAGQGLATSRWRGSAQHNSDEPGQRDRRRVAQFSMSLQGRCRKPLRAGPERPSPQGHRASEHPQQLAGGIEQMHRDDADGAAGPGGGREGHGREGARACEGFTSALAGRPAPGQAQTAFADPASRTVPTAQPPQQPVRSDCRRSWCGHPQTRSRPQQRSAQPLAPPNPPPWGGRKAGIRAPGQPGAPRPLSLSGSAPPGADQPRPGPAAARPPGSPAAGRWRCAHPAPPAGRHRSHSPAAGSAAGPAAPPPPGG